MKEGLWERVVERDAQYVWEHSEERISQGMTLRRFMSTRRLICVVPVLEPTNRHICSGKQQVDHVKDAPRLSKRAPDDEQHLVAMCEAHNVWYPPSRALRQAERAYLRSLAAG